MRVCRAITHSKVYKKNCHSPNSTHTLSISLYYNSETFPVQIAEKKDDRRTEDRRNSEGETHYYSTITR